MSWLILNDELDYPSTWYPTHIVSKDNKLLSVFIGAPNTLIGGLIGIYVRDKDYKKIRHDKSYIFIHDPDVNEDDIEKINWDEIEDVKDRKTIGRSHIHLWKDVQFDEEGE